MWNSLPLLAALLLSVQDRSPEKGRTRGREKGPEKALPEKWWNDNWTHRRTLTVGNVLQGSAPENVAVAEVPTLGTVNPDGSDLRVLDREDREMKVQVLACGDEDRALVAFEAPYRGPYRLYFGNPLAKPAFRKLDFRAGLILEVRALGEGDARDWPAMQSLLGNSPERTGRWWTPSLSLGFNPLGPWNRGIFLFTGYLLCPTDGPYTFAVNSIDASFLFVDGQRVAEWPGWHDASGGNHARHRGAIDLRKGIHKIEFINAFRHHGACTVGWQKPEDPRITPIPPQAFAGCYAAKPGPAETKEGPAADFEWDFADDLGYEGRQVTAVRFHPLARGDSYAWDFGDGVTSREPAPVHVYLEPRTYAVSCRIGGKDVTQKVRVQPARGHGGKRYEQRVKEYADRVREYPTDGLSAAACYEMGLLCHEAKDLEAAVGGFRAAVEKGFLPSNGEEQTWIQRLWELYRDGGKYDDALWVCDRLLDRKPQPPLAVHLLVMKAEILYDFLDRADAAEACCRKVLDQFRSAPSDYVRLAYVRSGEFALLRGDREGARKILEDAERSDQWRRYKGDFLVSEGAHSINFEEYLRRKEFEAAFREIEAWMWDKPTDVLGGFLRHLRGRVFLAMQKPDLAVREFDRALAYNPRAAFADEALFWKGEACETLKKPEDARRCFEKILFEFPESQLASRAKEKVK